MISAEELTEFWSWRRLLRVPWTARRSNQFIPKEINPDRSGAEAETPILWPPDVKNQLIRKDPDAGKDWRQEEKGTTEDAIIGWHHWLDGYECKQALGDGEGQGSWHAAIHGVAKSLTLLSYWNNCQECLLHPERACSVTNRLQWPGGGSRRHPCSWRREAKRKGTPVEVLPGLERRTRGNEQTNFLCLFHRAGPVPGLLQKLLSAHPKKKKKKNTTVTYNYIAQGTTFEILV